MRKKVPFLSSTGMIFPRGLITCGRLPSMTSGCQRKLMKNGAFVLGLILRILLKCRHGIASFCRQTKWGMKYFGNILTVATIFLLNWISTCYLVIHFLFSITFFCFMIPRLETDLVESL